MNDIRESALNALLAWDAARRQVNRLRSERDSHRCTEAASYDHETGDPGQAACWRVGDTESMCDECKARQPLMEPIQFAVRKASELRQKMQRQAARLAKVETADHSTQRSERLDSERSAEEKLSNQKAIPR